MTSLTYVSLIKQARTWLESKHYDDAQRLCQKILRDHPNDQDSLHILATISWELTKPQEAINYVQRCIKAYPKEPVHLIRLADFYNKMGRHREAIQQLHKGLKISPNHPLTVAAIARTHELEGNLDAALKTLEPFIAAGGASAEMVYAHASILFNLKQYEAARAELLNLTQNLTVPAAIRPNIWFLLGRVHESLNDFDRAFDAYAQGNRLIPADGDDEERLRKSDELIEAFSPQLLAKLPRAHNQSRLPVFIICRPRSGSTLVERIIAAHPHAHAGGEQEDLTLLERSLGMKIGSMLPYPQCIRDLDQNDVDSLASAYLTDLQRKAPRAARITNKSLVLWEHVGLISLLFPKAAIIDLRRDPIDNCLSCFTANLAAEHFFARDLGLAGRAHRQYERVMDHWHRVLDIPILKVNYEDIVANQEAWTRRIIEFCGLAWDDKCLRFYEKSAVRSTTANPTLSFNQVRQPIYKTSVARAKNFEKHLGPLFQALEEGRRMVDGAERKSTPPA